MDRYETEEQQVEAIKRFWKENGTALILGAVIGLGGLWGWRYYSDAQLENKSKASAAYSEIARVLSAVGDDADIQSYLDDYKNTGYASLTALIAAHQSVLSDDLENAEQHLNTAIELSKSDAITDIARIRLARVQLSSDKLDESLATLESVKNEAFSDQVKEVKGDVYVAKQDFEQARIAYASVLAEDENNRIVELKLSNIAYAATKTSGEVREN